MTPFTDLLAAHWPALTTLGALLATGSLVGAWRRHQRALRDREDVVLLPTESFDPSPDELMAWAKTLAATRRRRDWPTRRAQALRFTLEAGEGGLVRHHLSAPRRALALLGPALPHQVELLRPEPLAEAQQASGDEPGRQAGGGSTEERAGERLSVNAWERRMSPRSSIPSPRFHRARAELSISPSETKALAALGPSPDPLAPLVAAMAGLAAGERAAVALDLQPLSRLQLRRHRSRARRRDQSRPDWTRQLTTGAWLNEDPLKPSPTSTASTATNRGGALSRLEARAETLTDHARFASGDPAFSVQLLLWAEAPDRSRARSLRDSLVAQLAPMHQAARWRRVGIPVGPFVLGGPDSPSRRRRFDHRALHGCFHPRKPSVTSAGEIAGLIKPPTRHCHAPNTVRGGGFVPAPPVGLRLWTPTAWDVFPIGTTQPGGPIQGVSLAETLFTAYTGRAGYGKTYGALLRAIHLARTPDRPASSPSLARPAVLFEDPHGDALPDFLPYLVDHADRVLEVNLRRRGSEATQAGWNPLSMEGCTVDAIESRVDMIVAAFAAVLGWTEKNNRGLNLVTQATVSLCQLGLRLPPDLQPTIFQLISLLADEGWRKEVLPFLSADQRRFWETLLAKQTGGGEAITPVTNLVTRLRAAPRVAALFGQSRSTFDMRRAMDAGAITLLCPGGAGDKEQLIHVLFLGEIFRALSSRGDIEPAQRRPVHAFLDEIQIADRGQSSEFLARSLQELRKFGGRMHLMVQDPLSLTPTTRAAISTNRTHLFTSTVNADAGVWLSKEMGAGVLEPATFTHIPRYHGVASVTLGGTVAAPFRFQGVPLEKAFGPPASPEAVAELERTIDRNMNRRPIAEVLADLDTLDARILDHLRGEPVPRPSGPPPSGRRPRPPVTGPSVPTPAQLEQQGVAWIDRARANRPKLRSE